MKLLIPFYCLAVLPFLQGCSDSMITNANAKQESALADTPVNNRKTIIPNATANLFIKDERDLIGYWVGSFEPGKEVKSIEVGERIAWDYSNKINLSIDKINGNLVIGHSVVAGNNRPFLGTFKKEGNLYSFTVVEPGDDKYDGKFNFSISTGEHIISGTWQANGKVRIPARNYLLTKKLFKYDPSTKISDDQFVDWTKSKKAYYNDGTPRDDYDKSYFATSNEVYKYNASTNLLTKEEVANLKKADIFILRNAIYARHGYSFKNQQLRAFFDRQKWYVPISTDVKSEFTEIEKKNIALLLRYEKNAKEYYDVFGRG